MESTYRYSVHSGYAPDAYGAAEEFGGTTRILDITIKDNPAVFTFSYDGVTFGDDYIVFSDDPPLQLPHAARAFKVRNQTAGGIAWYQVAGLW